MIQMNLPMKQKQNDGHRKWTGGCQGGGGWQRLGLADVSVYKWIKNKVRLYSTGNYS